MGCQSHLYLVGGSPGLVAQARERLEELESRWSRFIPASELSQLNAAGGMPCVVSPDTFLLLERAVQGWNATGGAFDPTVLEAMVNAGYDRDFHEVAADPSAGPVGPPAPGRGCASIRLDRRTRLVMLPEGIGIDPGGIGKGLAADLVVTEMLEAGAEGICVSVGGDVRLAGRPPVPEGWLIGIEDPEDDTKRLDEFCLADGAVATSTTKLHAWQRDGREQHHLIDPSTGVPAVEPALLATVVAGAGWWAEVLAKLALLAGCRGPELLAERGASGLVIAADGNRYETPDLGSLRRWTPREVVC